MKKITACLVLMLSALALTVPAWAEGNAGPGYRGGQALMVPEGTIYQEGKNGSSVKNPAETAGQKREIPDGKAQTTDAGTRESNPAAQSGGIVLEAQDITDTLRAQAALDAKNAKSGSVQKTVIGEAVTEESKKYQKGDSLGEFKITGYYGDGNTHSGVKPQANHTIAADLSILPLGTKVMINNTVYTVEDKGSAVRGKMIDIFYDTREEAIGVTYYGARTMEVFKAKAK